MAAKNNSNELHLTRIYDAPVAAVWKAWTDPAQLAKWWGPRGFTLTTHSKDLRPGGVWHYTMHGPDGVDYPNKTIYHEVEKNSLLVYDHGGYDDKPPLFKVRVKFSDEKNKTKMEMTMSLATPEAAEEIRKFIKQVGGNATWDRLAEYLDKETQGKDRFVINRSFAASVQQMYEMWTNPEHFANWLPPTGFKMEFLRAEIKAGGSIFYRMFNDQGLKMYGRAEYLELDPPHRIVYVQQFCDDKERMARHPMVPQWPERMLTTITLSAEAAGQTRVTVQWEPSGNVPPAELETFLRERPGMTQGWTGSMDKLEDYLLKFGGSR